MSILADCPACGLKVRVPETAAGKRAKCACGARFIIPAAPLGNLHPSRATPAENLDDLYSLPPLEDLRPLDDFPPLEEAALLPSHANAETLSNDAPAATPSPAKPNKARKKTDDELLASYMDKDKSYLRMDPKEETFIDQLLHGGVAMSIGSMILGGILLGATLMIWAQIADMRALRLIGALASFALSFLVGGTVGLVRSILAGNWTNVERDLTPEEERSHVRISYAVGIGVSVLVVGFLVVVMIRTLDQKEARPIAAQGRRLNAGDDGKPAKRPQVEDEPDNEPLDRIGMMPVADIFPEETEKAPPAQAASPPSPRHSLDPLPPQQKLFAYDSKDSPNKYVQVAAEKLPEEAFASDDLARTLTELTLYPTPQQISLLVHLGRSKLIGLRCTEDAERSSLCQVQGIYGTNDQLVLGPPMSLPGFDPAASAGETYDLVGDVDETVQAVTGHSNSRQFFLQIQFASTRGIRCRVLTSYLLRSPQVHPLRTEAQQEVAGILFHTDGSRFIGLCRDEAEPHVYREQHLGTPRLAQQGFFVNIVPDAALAGVRSWTVDGYFAASQFLFRRDEEIVEGMIVGKDLRTQPNYQEFVVPPKYFVSAVHAATSREGPALQFEAGPQTADGELKPTAISRWSSFPGQVSM